MAETVMERNKNILMVALNSSWSQSNLAFFYLREIIKPFNYSVQIIDFTLKDHLADVLSHVYNVSADIICFSAYIWNCDYLQKLIPELKKLLPHAIIVLGGPESINRDYGLTAEDFCISGSGEGAFMGLATTGFTKLSAQPHIPLKDIPFPYSVEDKATLEGKLVYYECYRGCPYGCVYCLSANDMRHELRFNPDIPADLDRLDKELAALVNLKPKTLKFIDRSFNIFPKLAHHIWKFFISNPAACEVHFEIYPDLLCEEDFRILETAPAGLIRFEVGIQTTNEAVAVNCGRNSNWGKAKQALISLKQRTNIRIHADLLAGLPGETYGSVLNSLNQLCSTLPDAVQLGMLKILPDTPMAAIAQERGYKWLNHPPYQCLSSDALSYPELCKLEALAKLLNLYWNKEEYPEEWAMLLQKHQASDLLYRLWDFHRELGYDLHSLARGKREQVMQLLLARMS